MAANFQDGRRPDLFNTVLLKNHSKNCDIAIWFGRSDHCRSNLQMKLLATKKSNMAAISKMAAKRSSGVLLKNHGKNCEITIKFGRGDHCRSDFPINY